MLHSNTVAFDILPSPSPADIEFRRLDPGAVGGGDVPAGGGQCLVDGGYIPLPPVEEGDGTPVDPEGGGTSDANGYYIGEPVVIAVTDGNRNTDPAVRELVEVAITTSTGDAESLRLQETDVDTGVFAGAIQSRLMPPAPVQYDCVLSLEAGAEIVARYTDSDFRWTPWRPPSPPSILRPAAARCCGWSRSCRDRSSRSATSCSTRWCCTTCATSPRSPPASATSCPQASATVPARYGWRRPPMACSHWPHRHRHAWEPRDLPPRPSRSLRPMAAACSSPWATCRAVRPSPRPSSRRSVPPRAGRNCSMAPSPACPASCPRTRPKRQCGSRKRWRLPRSPSSDG